MKILRVFTDDSGKFGNPVGIIVDSGKEISKDRRQAMALESGFSEIVFVNDLTLRDVSIYSPKREIPFAGHALVGVAYFLRQKLDQEIDQVISMGKTINTWLVEELTWVQGDLEILPSWNFEQLSDQTIIEELDVKQMAKVKHTLFWAWVDENLGIIRARTFAADWGIPEDEANGSGAMRLAALLNKEMTVHHGKGSVIYARPSSSNQAEAGGRVELTK